ncbi:MAG: Cof-type HAD-IIB family hydrolase [Desulforhopalus sp.]|nr:Cof-type HAD-IIB family hydrolase [Desulforhopalus sp.]
MRFSDALGGTLPQLIASDLDGTLLPRDGTFFPRDIETLHRLGEKGVIRAIVTGRNLHFAREAIPLDFPIDYLVFSSGAGIVRWPECAMIFADNLAPQQTEQIVHTLHRERLNFMIHRTIPGEHRFYFEQNCQDCGDFTHRLNAHRNWGTPLEEANLQNLAASQALAFIGVEESRFLEIKRVLPDVKVIRTSSPFGTDEIWTEIFPLHISKGAAVRWLCRELRLDMRRTMSIGNDYNDIDLLDATAQSFIVSSAPQELRQRYMVTPEKAGMSWAVKKSEEQRVHRN